MLRLAPVAFALAAWLSISGASELRAQGGGGGVSTVNAQSTGTTSSGGSGGSGGQSAGATNQAAGGTFGTSSTGAGGQGGAAQGGVQGPQFTAFGQGGAAPANGFVGRGNTGTFVGNTLAGQQTVNSAAASRFAGAGGGVRTTNAQATVSGARGGQMRIPQRISFAVAPLAPAAIQLKLQAQFSELEQTLPGVSAQVDAAGTVTLQGAVADADARRLAEALALLEPGVVQVNNELQVAP